MLKGGGSLRLRIAEGLREDKLEVRSLRSEIKSLKDEGRKERVHSSRFMVHG
jgi:hypothetical protein